MARSLAIVVGLLNATWYRPSIIKMHHLIAIKCPLCLGFFAIHHRLIVLLCLCDDSALSLCPQPHNVGSNGGEVICLR